MLHFFKKTPNKQQIARVKVLVFLLCTIPMLRLIWLGFQEDLTANPIEFLERSTGFWALMILLATLTPVSYTHLDVYKRQEHWRSVGQRGQLCRTR